MYGRFFEKYMKPYIFEVNKKVINDKHNTKEMEMITE